MKFHLENQQNVLSYFKTDEQKGLSAEKIKDSFEKYGPNQLKEKKKKTLFSRFMEQFKDVMILILLAAAAVSFVIAIVEKNPKELFEPALILLIVILNAAMGVVQESKAEKALDALKNMSALHAKVIREGKETVIDSTEIVPGDIMLLEAGDFVPADARLIKSSSLKCEESALTGESVPSEKDADAEVKENAALGDRVNMVYSGCSVSYGTATAVVTATGMNTEIGKIAGMLDNEVETQTPLQEKLSKLGKYLGVVALLACAIIFIIGLLNGIPVIEIFMTSISLAVSAIPEGLPAIVTIVLSIGVQRMVSKNAIIRRLPAVETLGSASVICSDKTGTLTQNRMTLVKIYTEANKSLEDVKEAVTNEGEELLMKSSLCCNGSVVIGNEGKVQHIGDPTETAIVYAAHLKGHEKNKINSEHERVFELPFDSERKLMTTINKFEDGYKVIVKGAFDMLAGRCIKGDIPFASQMNDEMSSSALRVLAVAEKTVAELPETLDSETLENGLSFIGLLGMIDPPREEAKQAVAVCKKAGIRPVMITGDHIVTATAIAKQLGIYNDGDKAITGIELDNMTEAELDKAVTEISVYARVSPENKIRIVKAWQKKGKVVAMTGDGVNDAPALKAADIGCAMGITGTDVAKGASDMTLTDDNFATIVDAVREGRGIYANIKKVVGFLLGTNIGEIFTVFFAMLLWHQTPLLSMQLLWINLVTDSLPAISLGMENVEKDIMDAEPKPKEEGIFAHGYGLQILLQGIMIGFLTLTAFRIGVNKAGLEAGQTMAFMVLSLSQLTQAFNMRSGKSLFKIGFFTNSKLNLSCLASFILVAVVLFTPLSSIFSLTYLSIELYAYAFLLALAPLPVMEFSKLSGFVKHRK